MGRLPLQFSGRPITWRVPYTMPGEIVLLPNQSGIQFPDSVFSHQIDKPFEIHRVHITLTGFTTVEQSGDIMLEPQPESLGRRIKLRMTDYSKNESLFKSSALVPEVIKHNEETWEWEEPYTLVRAEGFQVQVDSASFDYAPFLTTPSAPAPAITKIRLEVAFQGFLIVIEKPSETR